MGLPYLPGQGLLGAQASGQGRGDDFGANDLPDSVSLAAQQAATNRARGLNQYNITLLEYAAQSQAPSQFTSGILEQQGVKIKKYQEPKTVRQALQWETDKWLSGVLER